MPKTRRSSRIRNKSEDNTKRDSKWWRKNLSDDSLRRYTLAANKNVLTSDSEADSVNPEFWRELSSRDDSRLIDALKINRKKISNDYEEQINISENEVQTKQLFTKKNMSKRFSRAFAPENVTPVEGPQPEEEQQEKEGNIEEARPSTRQRTKMKKSILFRNTKEKRRFSAAFVSMETTPQYEDKSKDINLEISAKELAASNKKHAHSDNIKPKQLFKDKSENKRKFSEAFSKLENTENITQPETNQTDLTKDLEITTENSKPKQLFKNKSKNARKFSESFPKVENIEPEANQKDLTENLEITTENSRTKQLFKDKSKNARKFSEAFSKLENTENITEPEINQKDITENLEITTENSEPKQLFKDKSKKPRKFSEAFSKIDTTKNITKPETNQKDLTENLEITTENSNPKQLFKDKSKNARKFSEAFSNLENTENITEPEINQKDITENLEITTENPKLKQLFKDKSKNTRKFSEAFSKIETTKNITKPETNQKDLTENLEITIENSNPKQLFKDKSKNARKFSEAFSKLENTENITKSETIQKDLTKNSEIITDNSKPTQLFKDKSKNARKFSEAFSKVETTKNITEPEINQKDLTENLEITTESSKPKQLFKEKSKNTRKFSEAFLKLDNAENITEPKTNQKNLTDNLETTTETSTLKQLFKDKSKNTRTSEISENLKDTAATTKNKLDSLRGKLIKSSNATKTFSENESSNEISESEKNTDKTQNKSYSLTEEPQKYTKLQSAQQKPELKQTIFDANRTEFSTVSSINESNEPEKHRLFKSKARKSLFNTANSAKTPEKNQSKPISSTSGMVNPEDSIASQFFETSLISSTKLLNLTSAKTVSDNEGVLNNLGNSTKKHRISTNIRTPRKSESLSHVALKPISEGPSFEFKEPTRSTGKSPVNIREKQILKELKNSSIEVSGIQILNDKSKVDEMTTHQNHSLEIPISDEFPVIQSKKSTHIEQSMVKPSSSKMGLSEQEARVSEIREKESESDESLIIKSKRSANIKLPVVKSSTSKSDLSEKEISISEIPVKESESDEFLLIKSKKSRSIKLSVAKTSIPKVGLTEEEISIPEIPEQEPESDESLIIKSKKSRSIKLSVAKTNASKVRLTEKEISIPEIPEKESESDESLLIKSKKSRNIKLSVAKASTSKVGLSEKEISVPEIPEEESESDEPLINNSKNSRSIKLPVAKTSTSKVGLSEKEISISEIPEEEFESDESLIKNSKNSRDIKLSVAKTSTSKVGLTEKEFSISELPEKESESNKSKKSTNIKFPVLKASTSKAGLPEQEISISEIQSLREKSPVIIAKELKKVKLSGKRTRTSEKQQETNLSKTSEKRTENDESRLIKSKKPKEMIKSAGIETSSFEELSKERSQNKRATLSVEEQIDDRILGKKSKQLSETKIPENKPKYSEIKSTKDVTTFSEKSTKEVRSGVENSEDKELEYFEKSVIIKKQRSVNVGKSPLRFMLQSELETSIESIKSRTQTNELKNIDEQSLKLTNLIEERTEIVNTTMNDELNNFHVAEDLIISNLMSESVPNRSDSENSISRVYYTPTSPEKDKKEQFMKLFEQMKQTVPIKVDKPRTPKKQSFTPKITGYFPTLNKHALVEKPKKVSPVKRNIQTAKLINGKIYKPPKLFKGERWCNARFYTFLQKKLHKLNSLKAVIESENLMKEISTSVSRITKSNKYMKAEVNSLLKTLAKSNVIETTFDFYRLVEVYLPFEFRQKVIPCTNNTFVPFKQGQLFKKIKY